MESNFKFIKNKILKQNIDEAFEHILVLLPFTESVTYNEIAKSAFRKTIIIHTASIVEALLFNILNTNFNDSEIQEFYTKWDLVNKSVLYSINDSYIIVAGDYKKVSSKTTKEKLNLGQISGFLKENKIINKNLFNKIDKIRILRNEQHIGTHKQVKSYTKDDLELAFSIANEVKEFSKKM